MVNSLDDRKIIELFFERSEQANIELSNKYDSVCSKVAFNILNNKQDTEECVNDAYLGTWNTIPPQNPNPLLSYVCRIVRNIAIKKYHANTAATKEPTISTPSAEGSNLVKRQKRPLFVKCLKKQALRWKQSASASYTKTIFTAMLLPTSAS